MSSTYHWGWIQIHWNIRITINTGRSLTVSIKSNSFTISAGRIYGWVLCCVASDFTRAPNKVAIECTSFAIWAKQPFKITCSIHVWNDISRQICTWLCVAALLTVYETGSECRRVYHFFFSPADADRRPFGEMQHQATACDAAAVARSKWWLRCWSADCNALPPLTSN